MNILIIRSTSIQHLALAVHQAQSKYASAKIDCLTHPHSLDSVREMQGINAIHPYPSTRNFSPFTAPASCRGNYALVIVPVSNMTGAGFENVLLLALRFQKRRIVLCDLRGGLIPISRGKILARALRQFAATPLAVTGAVILTAINVILIIILHVLGRGLFPLRTNKRRPSIP